jgi:hypothetical protein
MRRRWCHGIDLQQRRQDKAETTSFCCEWPSPRSLE